MSPKVVLVVLIGLCSVWLCQATIDPAVLDSLKAFAAGFDYFPVNWPLATVDPCDAPLAYGGTIICENNKVVEIRLGSLFEKIQGTLPTAITGVTDLEVLDLYNNAIKGTIPDLSPLQNLQLLFLNRNRLEGTIPESLGELQNLTSLLLSFNRLTGKIPDALGELENLEALYLSGNELEGDIPSSLGNLTELLVLGLHYNNLTSIPSSLDSLGNLVFMYMQYNHLVGPIPAFMGLPFLKVLHLGGNNLTGTIPDFQNLGNLRGLVLGPNKLNGTISQSIGNSPHLEQFLAGGNQLEGEIPTNLGSLSALKRLELQYNLLVKGIPEFTKPPQYMNLSNNKLRKLPPFLTTSPIQGSYYDLRNNSFPCPVPAWCGSNGNSMCLPCRR